MAATIRLCFGMARDNQLPGSAFLAKVSPGLHTPVWSCVAVACIAAIPFWQYPGAGIIAIAATGLLHLNFLDGVPILWLVVLLIALVGAVYYLAVGRRKTFPPVVSPAEDDAPLAV